MLLADVAIDADTTITLMVDPETYSLCIMQDDQCVLVPLRSWKQLGNEIAKKDMMAWLLGIVAE